MIAAITVALVLALVVVVIIPRILSKKAMEENSATMENVNPSDYIAEPVDLGLCVRCLQPLFLLRDAERFGLTADMRISS